MRYAILAIMLSTSDARAVPPTCIPGSPCSPEDFKDLMYVTKELRWETLAPEVQKGCIKVASTTNIPDAHFWRLVGNCIVSPMDLWKY
jgi:hypothetical protein